MSKTEDEVLALFAEPVTWPELFGTSDLMKERILRVYEAGLEDGVDDHMSAHDRGGGDE